MFFRHRASDNPHRNPTARVAGALRVLAFAALMLTVAGMQTARAADPFDGNLDGILDGKNGLPDQMQFSYKVSRGSIELGVILNSLKKSGENYRSTTITRPNGFVKLLGADDGHQETEFELGSDGFLPVSYLEQRSDRPLRRVEFDHQSGLIRFIVETNDPADPGDPNGAGRLLKRVEKAPDYDAVDIGSLPFYLMTKPIFELAGRHIGIVTGKKVGHYKIEEPVSEVVQTAMGELTTWRIENQHIVTPTEEYPFAASWSGMGVEDSVARDNERKKKESSSITVWLSPSHNNLPVKIVKRQGKRETTMTLESVDIGTE